LRNGAPQQSGFRRTRRRAGPVGRNPSHPVSEPASRKIESYATYFVPGGRLPVPAGMELQLDPGWNEERALWQRGYRFVAGVDEVGRGCLAGPVVAGAVILPPGWAPHGLRDSKLLDPEIRADLAAQIRDRAIAWAIAAVDHTLIDRINILQATLLAAMRAAARLPVRPDALILDALWLPAFAVHQRTLIDADRLSVSVAAASVVAKVYRDALMTEEDRRFPGYGFASHKGYSCPEHWAAISALGASPLHRLSFAPFSQPAGIAEADSIALWPEEDG
jgi:ribonuclease HII